MYKKKVAIYVRVSTLEQAEEGHSIQEQTDRLKKYCEAMGWIVADIYTDGGYTGSNTDRPALSRLISDSKNGAVDIILVYKLDRLSRSQKDTLYLIEDVFLKNNVEFVSMCENFDTSSPFGRAMIGILSVFAQLEREQIKERMAMGHVGRAKEGYWRGGSNPPLGYDFINGNLILNDYEAMQVRELYNLFISGESIHGACKILRSKYKNRYSSWNNTGTAGKMLRNKLYIGKIEYKGEEYEGQHKAIIDSKTFKKAQDRYLEVCKNSTVSQKTPFKSKHLLSGLMFCGNCGARYFTTCTMSKKFGTYYYYKCYSRDGNAKMKRMDKCKNKIYREDILDNIVIDELRTLAYKDGEIEKLQKQSMGEPDENINIIAKRIQEIDKQSKKLMDLYQLGNIPIEEIGARMSVLMEEKKKLEAESEKYQDKNLLSIGKAKELLNNFADIIDTGTLEERRRLVNALISKVILNNEEVSIEWKFCK